VRFRLLPTDDRFFELFADAAANVAECAVHLREVVAGGGGGVEKIVACERRGDQITRDILQRLNTSFVTPFDREDIHALAEELDDVVDDVLEVIHKLDLGGALDLSTVPELKDQADLLVAMADEVVELIARLEPMKGIQPYLDTVDRMESEGDVLYRHALHRLLSGDFDPILVIRWKDVIESMEGALNTLEDVSNVVESIVLKHA
jgi:predicted phosphate transport protein (TIGR00153 family)